MYYPTNMYSYPYSYNANYARNNYWIYPNFYYHNYFQNGYRTIELKDYGPNPFAEDINEITLQNNNFRTALWTGSHFQVTLMSLNPGEDIGLEMHPDVDQFLRLEQGQGMVQMGKSKDHFTFEKMVADDFAIVIPAGTWHNLTNIGDTPLKLYSIYAPPNHPFGTVHPTKADAEADEEHM